MLGAVQALKSGHPPHSQWAGSGLSTKLSPKKVFSKCLHGLIDNLSLKPGSLGPLMQNENGDRKRGSGVKGLCQAESPSVSCCPHAGWDASSPLVAGELGKAGNSLLLCTVSLRDWGPR